MYEYDVAQVIAEGRRKEYERQAEIHRWLHEAESLSPRRRRAAFSSRVLYGVGRLLVRAGSRLQQPYGDRVGMAMRGGLARSK